MQVKKSELSLDKDVYIACMRGAHAELMLNAGYEGVQTFDVAIDRIVREIPFPSYIRNFAIETWLTSPDGSKSYLFSREDEGFALELNYDSGEFRAVRLPPKLQAPTGLCWFDPDLNIYDYRGQIWVLRGGLFEEGTLEAVPKRLRMPLHIDDPDDAFVVLRMCYPLGGFYVMNNAKIGFVSYDQDFTRLSSNNRNVIGVALLGVDLLLFTEDEIILCSNSTSEAYMQTPAAESFMFVETFTIKDEKYVLVLSAKEGSTGSMLRSYVAQKPSVKEF